MSRLRIHYQQQVIAKLKTELDLANLHQVPKLEKVVINIGAGRAVSDNRFMEVAINTLRKISGQHPLSTTAKHSIAGFKLRQGQKIGLKVTLRADRMYDFMDRLISIVLPRMRDFHGLSRSAFDAAGNYNLGLSDQSVFPELPYEDTTLVHGLQISIVTSSNNLEHNAKLLEMLGLPLEKSSRRG